jgi:hypothetical protein
MRKLILFFAVLFCLQHTANAQAVSGQSDYNKNMYNAITNEYPFGEGTTDDAIVAKFKALGYSCKNDNDYRVFKGVKIPELGPDTYDLYFRTDKKNKKEKDKSVVYMLISKGNQNFVHEAAEPALFANAKTYLNNLVADVQANDLEKQIAGQEEIVKKANKKLSNLTDDGQDLVKKQNKIAQQIADNKNDQTDQQKEVQQQQQILDNLKAKRKQ